MTTANRPTLEDLHIASPCNARWEGMHGDDRVRFCSDCRLNVYDLSGMSRAEAEALVQRAEGRLCVRFRRREDGTVLTRDCPIGLRALRRGRAWAAARGAAVLAMLAGLLGCEPRRSGADAARHPGGVTRQADPGALMGEASVAPAARMGRIAAPDTRE